MGSKMKNQNAVATADENANPNTRHVHEESPYVTEKLKLANAAGIEGGIARGALSNFSDTLREVLSPANDPDELFKLAALAKGNPMLDKESIHIQKLGKSLAELMPLLNGFGS